MTPKLKIIGVLLAALTFSVFFTVGGWAAPVESDPDLDAKIAEQERAKNELDKKIRQYNETAQKKAQQAQSLLGRITGLRQNSKMAEQEIRLLELKSSKLQKSMAVLNEEMAETSKRVSALVVELRARLVRMYKYGSREELNLLLSAENTHEALAFAYLLARLAYNDRVIIDDLLHKMSELEQSRRSLENNRSQLARQSRELNIQQEKYNASISATNTLLSGVQQERKKAEQAAKEIEQAQREIGRTIMALQKRKRTREEELLPQTGGRAAPAPKEYTYLARGSMLEWPVKGQITSPYGPRVHPVLKTKSFNSGIDILAAANAPVRAAGPGEVLYEGWLRGFGQVVIIDHGNNISTVYAHMSSTHVKEGMAVNTGSIVGTVGNSGTAEDPSLHFEVRVGEAAKNPLDYLKKS
jgi:murein DD-endopeptidase MepM/ murein hydrolase activator NlpD